LNYRYHWVPLGFLINALIVAPGVVALVRNTPKVPVVALGTAVAAPAAGNPIQRVKNRNGSGDRGA
jgi:hypothetical protein